MALANYVLGRQAWQTYSAGAGIGIFEFMVSQVNQHCYRMHLIDHLSSLRLGIHVQPRQVQAFLWSRSACLYEVTCRAQTAALVTTAVPHVSLMNCHTGA